VSIISKFYATCNNLISNTTHLVISEDRKLLHSFKSDFVKNLSGFVAANYLGVVAYIKRACVCVTRKCSLNMGELLTQSFNYC